MTICEENSIKKTIVTVKNNDSYICEFIDVNVSKVDSLSIKLENHQSVWCIFLLYDSKGKLRAQRMPTGEDVQIYIAKSQEFTSPYCVSGSFPEGPWKLEFYALLPENLEIGSELVSIDIIKDAKLDQSNLTDELWLDNSGEGFISKEFFAQKIQNSEKKWYSGDFHTHTVFSDGKMTREENNTMALKQGLDFFVATDHHILPISWPKNDDIIVFPGTEITSPLGHMNILFAEESPFKEGSFIMQNDMAGLEKIISEVPSSSLRSINHPFLNPWAWEDLSFKLKDFDTLEIINDPTYHDNTLASEKAIKIWDILLKDGYKIAGIGGSDSHLRPDDNYPGSEKPSLIGDPATYVFSENLSSKALTTAIKNCNIVVARCGFIDFNVSGSIAGESCKITKGSASVKLETPSKIEWVVDGEVKHETFGDSSSFDYDLDEGYHYIRVNIRNEKGGICGFSNPVFFGSKNTTLTTWEEALEQMKNII